MTLRYALETAVSRLGRLGWLAGIALPLLLAACGRDGSNSGY